VGDELPGVDGARLDKARYQTRQDIVGDGDEHEIGVRHGIGH
jgi:hypothetical protein